MRPDGRAPTPSRRRVAGLLVVLLAPVLLAWVPSGTVRAAGPVVDLSRALAGLPGPQDRPLHPGRFLLTSVRDEHDPLWLWATRSLVQPGWTGGGTAAGPLNTLAQMRDAVASAWEVAVNLPFGPGDRATLKALADTRAGPAPAVDTKGLTGPSGGLMLALAFTDTRNRGDLTGGRTVAGTGTIDWDGTVGEIGYVRYKVLGAAAAGATVFFVPWANAGEAFAAAPAGMQVVPVADYDDAVGWLCDHGAGDAACVQLPGRPPG